MDIAPIRSAARGWHGDRELGSPVPDALRRRSVVVAAAAFAAVWVIAGCFRVVRPLPGPLDHWWDSVAGTHPGTLLHAVATAFAVTGTGFPAVAIALTTAAMLGAARGWIWSSFVLAASLLSEADVLALKALAMRARPDAMFGIGTSFPSGHTANAALLGTVVVLLTRRLVLRILAVGAMLAMAWSRTAIHAHWLTDVLAGLAIGAGIAVLLYAAFRHLVARRASSSSGVSQ